ncbi:MAG TPA: Wzz/FepE/Etk N-terminal domain-containing protein [Acidimicrobiia bacterium]|jgi:Mrp family chromosome partitioning ATPase
MEATQLIAMLRRRAWSIVRFTLIAGVAVGVVSYLRTPVYRASAQVLLRPNDPSETLGTSSDTQPVTGTDSGRYANSEAAIVQSPAVADAAAPNVAGGWSPTTLLDHLSVSVDPNSNVLTIDCTSTDPTQAQQCADKVADAYLTNRTQYQVATLEKAISGLQSSLTALEQQINTYTKQIGDGGGDAVPSAITGPNNPTSSPATTPSTAPKSPAQGGPTASGDTSDQTLLDARFAAETQYQQTFTQLQSLQVEKTLQRGDAELVSDAKLPQTPISPKPFRDAALGAIVGLLLGVGVSFLREQLDDKVHNAEELERLAGVPVLAQIPLDADVAAHPETLAASARPVGQFAESIRSLRTSLQFMGVDEPVRSVMVTSAVPGDGKTAVAANLGAVYAQAGLTTVLVSADMRRPRLDSMFREIELGPGLSGMLTEIAATYRQQRHGQTNGYGNGNGAVSGAGDTIGLIDDAVMEPLVRAHLVPTEVPNLSVLPAGLRAPNPAEVLGSRWMREVMAYLGRVFDVIVIDSSPTLAVTDAVVLSTLVDGVVLVVPSNEVSRGDVQRAIKTLDAVDARVLGTVLNRSSDVARQYYYYGYHARPADVKPAWRRKGRAARRKAQSEETLTV